MQLTLVYYISITIDKEIIAKTPKIVLKRSKMAAAKKGFPYITINIFDLVKEQNNFSMFFYIAKWIKKMFKSVWIIIKWDLSLKIGINNWLKIRFCVNYCQKINKIQLTFKVKRWFYMSL